MSYSIPLRQSGKMWGEIDPANYLLRVKRGKDTAVFNLRELLAREVQELIPRPETAAAPGVMELPELPAGAGIETVKRVAAASPFNQ